MNDNENSTSDKIIYLPKIIDKRGNLTFIESTNHIPFKIERVYWIYDVPGGEARGGHAFKVQEELIVAISGSFDVIVQTKETKKTIHLNRSYMGLYLPPGSWRSLENFSTNSLALVLASTFYDESDYIRSYQKFFNTDFNQLKNRSKLLKILDDRVVSLYGNGTKTTVIECEVVVLDQNHREKGNITVVENKCQIPFELERIYYLYDVPGGEERGGHAHKGLYQLIIAAGGSFDVVLDDGFNQKIVTLNRPYQGLYIVPGIWRELKNFSSGSTCLVLASQKYNEDDYIRNYVDFFNFKKNGTK